MLTPEEIIAKARAVSAERLNVEDLESYKDYLVVGCWKQSQQTIILSPDFGIARVRPSLYDDWLLCTGFAIYNKLEVEKERSGIRGDLFHQELKPLKADHEEFGWLSDYLLPKVKLTTETIK